MMIDYNLLSTNFIIEFYNVENMIRDAIILCGFYEVNLFYGLSPAARFATDIFTENLIS